MLGIQPVCCFTRLVVLRNSIYGIKSGFAFEWTAKLLSGKRIVLSWECCYSEHINVLDCLRKLVVSVLMLVNPSSEIIRKRLTGVLSYKSKLRTEWSSGVVDSTATYHSKGYKIDSFHSNFFFSPPQEKGSHTMVFIFSGKSLEVVKIFSMHRKIYHQLFSSYKYSLNFTIRLYIYVRHSSRQHRMWGTLFRRLWCSSNISKLCLYENIWLYSLTILP